MTSSVSTVAPLGRVAFLNPCFMGQFHPGTVHAAFHALRTLGLNPAWPAGQTCCGQPLHNSGYPDLCGPVVERLFRLFDGFDTVVVPSASCAAFLRHMAPKSYGSSPRAPNDTERGPVSEHFSPFERFRDFSEVLTHPKILARIPAGSAAHLWNEGPVALHVGCHGMRGLGLFDTAFALATHLLGRPPLLAADRDLCCGFGGAFSAKMPELSQAMGCEKLDNLTAVGARVVLTGDLSCAMHLSSLRRSSGTATPRFVHWAEVTEKAARSDMA